jgi:hypothetical protein
MSSPFPGMNPFLEQEEAWHDFHESFMPLVREILSPQVGADYIVKIDEHLYIHEVNEEQRSLLGRADVAVTGRSGSASVQPGVGLIEAPVQVELPPVVDVERQCFLEIRDRRNRQLITVLEMLSPANKMPGPDRERYIYKRKHLLVSRVHLVELDLLRGGPRMPFQDLPPCDYYAMISRVEQRPMALVWPLRLRQRLPEIPIPLREGDPDLCLDLQLVLHRIYDAAGYGKFIYEGTPVPPLSPEDAAWAEGLLATRS